MDINTIASLYNPVYLVLVTIVTMRFAATYKANSGLKTFKYPSSTLRNWLIVSALILIIGLRPISGKYFVDMAAYAGGYMRLLGEPFTYNWDVDNKIFDNLFAFWYGYKLGIVKFFVLIDICLSFAFFALSFAFLHFEFSALNGALKFLFDVVLGLTSFYFKIV